MATPAVDHHVLPYRIAVLCYVYDDSGRILLLHRLKDPNRDMYSPIGGKLDIRSGEGPHDCAMREIREETGLTLDPEDVRLAGVVSETAYQGETHWLIFLFEVMRTVAPAEITEMVFDEGTLEWADLKAVPHLRIPVTDRNIMWPLTQQHRGGFFVAHIDCREEPMRWELRESRR